MKKNSRFVKYVLAGLLLFGAMWALDMAIESQKSAKGKKSDHAKLVPTLENTREIVTKHMQQTQRNFDLSQRQIKTQAFLAPKVGDRIPLTALAEPVQGVPMDPDRRELNAPHDLNQKKVLPFQNPNPEIQGVVREQQDAEIASLKSKENFIAAYIENARLAGYDVKINEDLIVIEVRRIPELSNKEYIPPSSSAQ